MLKIRFHIFFLFLSIIPYNAIGNNQEKCVRGANNYGFFADFLWVINHIEYCNAKNLIPVIYWGPTFAYYSPGGYNGSTNGWEYYFEPVSELTYQLNDPLRHESWYQCENNFSSLWYYHQYIMNKHLLTADEKKSFKPIADHDDIYSSPRYHFFSIPLYPIGKYHIYSKTQRENINKEIIKPFIKIKTCVQEKIDYFYNTYMAGKKTIGIHLRGNHLGNEVLPIPLEYIFQEAKNIAATLGHLDYQFFVATDQVSLLEQAIKALDGKVVFYECERFSKTTSPYPGIKLHPKLGEDLLIETILLSHCDYLVHTLSNVSTAALYFNPELEHTVIY